MAVIPECDDVEPEDLTLADGPESGNDIGVKELGHAADFLMDGFRAA